MKYWLLVFTLCFSFIQSSVAFGGHGHYTSGSEGLKASTLPPPGFYYRAYASYYSAGEFRGDNGKVTNSDFDASVFALANRFIYSSDIEVLGANIVFDCVIPVVGTDIHVMDGVSGDSFGVGDILVEPLVLSWHEPWFDAAVGIGFWLPTGDFDRMDPSSIGKGFWSVMFTAGATVYFDSEKNWHASVLARYEIHTEQDETDITYGDDFSFEWGVGRTINKTIDIGIAGYCQWQLDKNTGKDADDNLHRAFAVGPEIAIAIPDWKASLSLRTLFEFENENSNQGNLTVLTFTKAF